MATLNTTFRQKANATLINNAFTSARIAAMHETMVRLYEAARELRNLSTPTEVARLLNQSQQTVNNWERRGMSSKGMVLAQEVIGCSASWLQTGNGRMLREGAGQQESDDEEFAMLRRLDVKASAGTGNLVFYETDKGKLAFRKDFLRAEGVKEHESMVIYADGQSMEPTIPDGAVMLVNVGRREISNNDIFVIRLDDEILVKRLRKEIGGGVLIVSDNPDKHKYPDILVTPDKEDHLSIIGRVFWMGARL